MNKKGIKEAIIFYSRKLKRLNFLAGSSGNLSIRYKDIIFITPSQKDKEDLKINDISEINLEGKVLNKITPSSEYLLHCYIYKNRKDINAIVHTHPPFTIAYSITRTKYNPHLTVECKYPIKFARFIPPGTKELALEVAKKVKDTNAVILENHGLVSAGETIEKATILTEEIENLFKINFLVLLLDKLNKSG